jgi:hypothetical protein
MGTKLSLRPRFIRALLLTIVAVLPSTAILNDALALVPPARQRLQMVATLRTHLKASHDLLAGGDTGGSRRELTASASYIKSLEPKLGYTVLASQLAKAERQVADGDDRAFYDHLKLLYPLVDQLGEQDAQVAHRIRNHLRSAATQARQGHRGRATGLVHQTQTDLARLPGYLPLVNINASIKRALTALEKTRPDTAIARKAIDNALLQFGVAFNE